MGAAEVQALIAELSNVRRLNERDLLEGFGEVEFPNAFWAEGQVGRPTGGQSGGPSSLAEVGKVVSKRPLSTRGLT